MAAKDTSTQALIDDLASQIEANLSTLENARDRYYNGDPVMTDAEYDALEDTTAELTEELKGLAAKHDAVKSAKTFFAGVGSKATSGWKKVKHTIPMGSLLKVQNQEQMEKWHASTDEKLSSSEAADELGSAASTRGLIITEKLDGISISLKYKEGKLVQAVTRGGGEEGEDITRNVRLMKGIKEKARDFTGYIRGEIVLFKSDHKKHVPEYKNPRNAASGIAKRESDSSLCKHLTVISYQVITQKHKIRSKTLELTLLEKLGFVTPNWSEAKSEEDVEKLYQRYVKTQRDKLDYDIDGLVVEYVDHQVMEFLGVTNGRPKGARAYKFPHAQQPTKLVDIRWQVGNSGRVTPVAIFEPVDLAGATVTQASLHNESNIRRLAANCPQGLLGKGDTILVSRRNDVIPYVEKLISPAQNLRFAVPKKCPSCDRDLKKQGMYVVCTNARGCPAQQSGAIKRWVKKLDIKEWGDSLIEALCETGMVKSIADLYSLDVDELAKLELSEKRLGKSSATKAMKNLRAKMDIRIADFVGSLGIDLCGQSVCQFIVDAGFDTLDKMEDATVAELEGIPKMGSTKAQAFVKGFRQRKKLIDDLLDAGITVKGPVIGKLTGTSFCFTGVRDKDLEGKIKDAGGTVKTSVGKGLDYLVAKDPNSTTGKPQKARKLGIKIITVDDARAML